MVDDKKNVSSKPKRSEQRFRVLVSCRNKTKRFEPGKIVTTKDFSVAVIENWLKLDPPVLEVINGKSGKE